MSDDVIWNLDPHTLAKHHILRRYLEAWAPILLQRGNSHGVLYIDGFAGPGEYKGGENGSPIIAMECILEHILKQNFNGRIVFRFIEERKDRAEHLERLVRKKYPNLPPEVHIKISSSEFNLSLGSILDKVKNDNKVLLPCFCFVDPFGWKDIDYDLLSRIMEHPKAELFITFMAGFLNRFRESEPHEESLSKLYSKGQLDQINDEKLTTAERQKLVLRFFVDNLKSHISKYTNEKVLEFSFSAFNETNNLVYYLIHLTKSCSGFNAMKEAMFNVKKDGHYSFSDFDFAPGQTSLMEYFKEKPWVQLAAEDVFNYFKSLFEGPLASLSYTALPVRIVKDRIMCNTKWIYRASILAHLEADGRITYHGNTHPKRRFGQYPEPGSIKFNL